MNALYQSEDHILTKPSHRRRGKEVKSVEVKKWEEDKNTDERPMHHV